MPPVAQDIPQQSRTLPTITLYGPEVCPMCDKAIAMFQKAGIAYTKIVIEKGDENYTYVNETLGYQTAPVIVLVVENVTVHWGGHRMDMLMATKRLFANFHARQAAEEEEVQNALAQEPV